MTITAERLYNTQSDPFSLTNSEIEEILDNQKLRQLIEKLF